MDDRRHFREILAEFLVEEGYAGWLAASAEAASHSMESEAHRPTRCCSASTCPG
ncbi:MAG TPA: hypothetical protein VMG32_01140 [Anaeromyxobacteraceae bacterium]|nr:hypothetical protein [Anaeromyxobacteraceae bacterium]